MKINGNVLSPSFPLLSPPSFPSTFSSFLINFIIFFLLFKMCLEAEKLGRKGYHKALLETHLGMSSSC